MATQEPTQSNDTREKMGRSKRSNWFIRYCCCCCACCCREDDVHRPLLHSTTPKEQTPVPASPPAVAERTEDGQGVGASGEETQQVQLVVADVEEEAPDSEPEEEGSDKDKPAKDKEGEKPVEVEVDLEPTERARVSSGTFVRGSSQRASWRLVPSFTQQIKEAREAASASEGAETDKEAAPANHGSNDESKQVEGAHGSEQISFKSDENEESSTSDLNVTLVAQDIDDEDASLEEPVTMTFTIGSRGNQEAPSSSTQGNYTPIGDEQQLQGQPQIGEEMTSSAVTTANQINEDDSNLESSNDMDQPTTPILTQQH